MVKTISDPSKVTIKMDLTHTWCGDVTVGLVVPGGATSGAIALIKRLGSTTTTGIGSSVNFAAGNILAFNSAATAYVVPGTRGTNSSVPAGTYLPTVIPLMKCMKKPRQIFRSAIRFPTVSSRISTTWSG